MTRLIPSAILLVFCLGCGAWGAPASNQAVADATAPRELRSVVQWHFLGARQLAANTNASRLREVLAQPATRSLLKAVETKLACATTNLASATGGASFDAAALLVPLLDDLLQAESVGVCRAAPNQGAGMALAVAVRLPADRATLWQTNWSAWAMKLGADAPAQAQAGGGTGWEAKWRGAPLISRLLQAGDWTLLSWGPAGLQTAAELAAKSMTGESQEDSWLRVDADLARLARDLGWLAGITWPHAELMLRGRGANLRTEGRLRYEQPLDLKLEAWRIPTNTVSDPLVSFTAVQGVRSWLSKQPWVKDLGFSSVPNQVLSWATANIPFKTYLGWQLSDPTNSILNSVSRLPGLMTNRIHLLRFGQIVTDTNRMRLSWRGLPVVEPFLQTAAGDAGFVVAGIFPFDPKHTPAPPDLYAQILTRTNLVYYDWELTQVRVDDWRQLKNLYWMLAGCAPPPTNMPANLWLMDTNVTRSLANAVTEITVTSPTELAFARSSALGLTGLELVAFMRWIDDPVFPRLSEPALSSAIVRAEKMLHSPSNKVTKPGSPPNPNGPRQPPVPPVPPPPR